MSQNDLPQALITLRHVWGGGGGARGAKKRGPPTHICSDRPVKHHPAPALTGLSRAHTDTAREIRSLANTKRCGGTDMIRVTTAAHLNDGLAPPGPPLHRAHSRPLRMPLGH